jgi:hypothetical protein
MVADFEGRIRARGGGAGQDDGPLFAIFYVDNACIATWDPVFLQWAIDHLVSTFEHVGLEINITTTKTMICTPGKIRLQLPADLY